MALDPWQIGQSNNEQTSRRISDQERRNNELVDQITYPMRRYANTVAEGQAKMINADMFMANGLSPTGGTPTAPARRYGSKQPGDPAFFDNFMGTVQSKGVSNPFALAAIAATGQAESGWSRVYDEWDDPSEKGVPGRSGLAMSWRNERLRAAREFARAQGDDPNKPSAQTQAAFFLQENPQLIQQLNNAPDLKSAVNLMRDAWQYADKGGGQTRSRFEIANGYLTDFGGKSYSRNQVDQRLGGEGAATGKDERGEYQLLELSTTEWKDIGMLPEAKNLVAVDPDNPITPKGKYRVRLYSRPPDIEANLGTPEPDPEEEGFNSFSGE
jgi:hypothetical protein